MATDYLEKAMERDNGEWPEGYEHLVLASSNEACAFALIAIAQELRRLNDALEQTRQDETSLVKDNWRCWKCKKLYDVSSNIRCPHCNADIVPF